MTSSASQACLLQCGDPVWWVDVGIVPFYWWLMKKQKLRGVEWKLSTLFLILPWVYFSAAHTVSFTSFTVVTETPLNGNSWENDLSWPPRDTPCGACRLSPFHLAPSCVESISLVESLKKASSCWGIQAFLSWSPYFPEKGQRHKQQTFYWIPCWAY